VPPERLVLRLETLLTKNRFWIYSRLTIPRHLPGRYAFRNPGSGPVRHSTAAFSCLDCFALMTASHKRPPAQRVKRSAPFRGGNVMCRFYIFSPNSSCRCNHATSPFFARC
jgi:hypothetical protein